MGLRLKYEGLLWDFTSDLQKTVLRLAQEGTGNLYVIVNYSGLYRMNHILKNSPTADIHRRLQAIPPLIQ